MHDQPIYIIKGPHFNFLHQPARNHFNRAASSCCVYVPTVARVCAVCVRYEFWEMYAIPNGSPDKTNAVEYLLLGYNLWHKRKGKSTESLKGHGGGKLITGFARERKSFLFFYFLLSQFFSTTMSVPNQNK